MRITHELVSLPEDICDLKALVIGGFLPPPNSKWHRGERQQFEWLAGQPLLCEWIFSKAWVPSNKIIDTKSNGTSLFHFERVGKKISVHGACNDFQ